MTIEMGNQGVPGPGGDAYETNRSENGRHAPDAPPATAATGQAESVGAAQPNVETGEEVALDFNYEEAVPGFEASASDCFNRALRIAQSLNHTSLSADHLMLALTMDPNARRLLERIGDVVQLREAATRRLGKMHGCFATGESFPSQTADLLDIRKTAREAAAERDQLVAISDLINAFPKLNGRLSYGAGDASKALVLMERIEQGLVPRVADAMMRIEAEVQEATRRYQSVQSMLQDLNSRQSVLAEQRQMELMEQIRRQVREAADAQIGAALTAFTERLDAKLAELNPQVKQPEPEPEPDPEPRPYEPEIPRPRPSYWTWFAL